MKKLIVSLCAGLLMLGFAGGAKAASIAAGLPAANYSDSSHWNGQTAKTLFNGGSWNSGKYGTQWAEVDLGGLKSIMGVQFTTNQSPNGPISVNIFTSNIPIKSTWTQLTPIATFNQPTINGTTYTLTFAPVYNQYLEIVVNGGKSWTALADAKVIPTPEPSSMILGLISLAGAMGARKRKTA